MIANCSSMILIERFSLTLPLSALILDINIRLLTHVQPIKELPNILIPDSARLLDIRRRL